SAPQSSSISVSTGTWRPRRSARSASSASRFEPVMSTGRPSTPTWKGPRTPISNRFENVNMAQGSPTAPDVSSVRPPKAGSGSLQSRAARQPVRHGPVPTEPPVFGRSPSNRPPGSITIRFMAGGSVLALDAAADARGRTRSPLTLSALGKAAEAVPMVLLVTLVPRLLGPGPYGRVALAVGGPMLLTRFVPAAEPTGRPALARALAVRLAWLRALTLTGVAGVAAVLGVARPDVFHPFELVLVVGALWLDVAATLFFQVALSLDRAALWAFRYAFQNALLVAAVSAFAVLGGTSEAIAGVTVASAGALVVGAVTALPTLARAQRGSPIPPGALRFGVVQGAGGVLAQFMHRAAVPAVAVLAARETQTGYAGLAVGIGLAGTYAVWQAFALQLPRLSMRADAMPRAVETAAERLAWLALLFSGAGAVAAALAVGPALPLLAGERFRGAEAAVAPALALLPLAPLSGLVTQVLALRLRADIRFWSSLAGAVVFVATAVATVPRYGAVGGTSALLAGSAAATLVAIARLPSIVSRRLVLASLALTGLTVAIASVPDPGEAAAEAGDIAA